MYQSAFESEDSFENIIVSTDNDNVEDRQNLKNPFFGFRRPGNVDIH